MYNGQRLHGMVSVIDSGLCPARSRRCLHRIVRTLCAHSSDAEKPQHYFNGGLTFLVNDDIQWDVRAGKCLNDAADDYFVGTGLSIRFKY